MSYGPSHRFDQPLLDSAHSQTVAVSSRRRQSDGLASNLPLYRLRTAYFGQTNGHLHILFAGRGDLIGHTDLPQESRRQTLAQKLTLQSDDRHTAMNSLPRGRVPGKGRTVQIHVHVVQKAEKLAARQP